MSQSEFGRPIARLGLGLILCIVATINPACAEKSSDAKAKSAPTAGASNDIRSDARARQKTLADVKSWAIQLRYLDRAALAAAPIDLIVLDHAPHPKSDTETPFTPADLQPLKQRPNGARRLVLGYLSIGEAERYRFYWKPEWDAIETRPVWLGPENQRWPGDYQVDFANPEWQSIIFGTPESYLDRIIEAGFDGVYLDRADAFQDVDGTMPGAEEAMIGFVSRLADYARRLNPKFLVIMQNAEELARSKSLLARLDGLSKEDLAFGHDNSETPNPTQMVRDSVGFLRRAKSAGLKIFILEYPTDPAKIATVANLARREGFVFHITDRLLGRLSLDGGALPAAEADAPPEKIGAGRAKP